MYSIYDLKPAFQKILRPAAGLLAAHGISPNQITIAALLISCSEGAAIALQPEETWPLSILPLVLFIRMSLNAMDGLLAREYGMETPLGVIINDLGDVVSDAIVYLPLALVPGLSAPAIISMTMLAILVEMTGVTVVQIGVRRNQAGPMGKSDRALVIGSLGLVLGFGVTPGLWSDMVLYLVNLLIVVTIFNRIRKALEIRLI